GRNHSNANGDSTVIKQVLCAATLCFAATLAHGDVILNEGFDNVPGLGASGWATANNSSPIGDTGWVQCNSGIFGAQACAENSYSAANFLNAGVSGAISNWLITPELTLLNGEIISFYTRTDPGSGFADSLEVRLSGAGASTNVGATASSVGDFTTLLGTV